MTRMRDVVIVGGGHNALVAAAYLAGAGRSVTLLERQPHLGGAAISAEVFPGVEARLSRYSYLVSLLPERIRRDLRLDIALARRRFSSYTPLPGTDRGLLVDTGDADATAASFAGIGAASDLPAWNAFGADTARLAAAIWPTVTDPLLTRAEARRAVGDDRVWAELVEAPIGQTVEHRFADDLVRGVVLTDALIGTFAPVVDPTLAANRCFLYHVIGGGTGHWDVPVGGMGAVSGALARAARDAGAELITGAEVTSVTPDGEVSYRTGDAEHRLAGATVLSGVAPFELARLLGERAERPEGAQVKVNLLLTRLPRLRDASADPAAAFAGTFHVHEGFAALDTAHASAAAGRIPAPLPLESYCHSLTDPGILSPELRAAGAQTLTVFALQTPDRLLEGRDPDTARAELQDAVLASLDSVLAEPIANVLMTDAAGNPCIETATTRDLEQSLRMPGGNIFHGPLAWPWAEDDTPLATPAERWGVATAHPRILLCGSGSRRGGAVSGLGGYHAAMATLES
ncbi:phytoene desaturase family protein [Protaetiibacter intestinalis]|uniref:NAD(P)/FAD-dependent oxidoreductase n=1 Tax=Protaetiibacter intestinalis TaxID=2419774 RepID=A0A387B7K1_9MICO|nr:NAD(P)/FAD-dependent oxidoreductase [Protaetiibacter intestinalis]AYF97771.1 NAD(P)/FAD-dependent oxidoreductase [Protaetiibacter intestinalis]